MNTITITDRLRVPKSLVPRKGIEKRYNIQLYEESACAKCDNIVDRPNDLCEGCPAFIANYKLFKEDDDAWLLPQGDLDGFLDVLDRKNIEYTIREKRRDVPFSYKLRFTGSLYGKGYVDSEGIPRANQKKALRSWLDAGYGLLVSPPRSGKTVMAAYLICKYQQRSLVMVHQFEIMKQFKTAFYENTNIAELEKEAKQPLVALVETITDLKRLTGKELIVIINHHKFIYDASRIETYLNKKFGLLLVDEVHNTGADGYLKVVAAINVKYRFGMSATPARKDNRHKLIQRLLGSVTVVVESTSLIPTIALVHGAAQPPTQYKMWNSAEKWIASNKELRKQLVLQLFEDLKTHEVILVPVNTKKHQQALVKSINDYAAKCNASGAQWPRDLAVAFNGEGGTKSTTRAKALQRVDAPGATILVAVRKMIREGVNFIRPSLIHLVIPMSSSKDKSIGAPMFYQLATRICTPAKKPTPVIKIWYYDVGIFHSCLNSLFWFEIAPNKYNGKTGRYRVPDAIFSIIKNMPRPTATTKKLKNNRSWS